MYTRPKPTDNEEDILAMQEAFLAEKEKNKDLEPAAKVINLRKHKANEPSVLVTEPKLSKYALAKGLKKRKSVHFTETPSVLGEVLEKESEIDSSDQTPTVNDNVYFPTIIGSVLGNVLEKNIEITESVFKPSVLSATGFPEVLKIDKTILPGTKSIFAQQMERKIKMEVDNPGCQKEEQSSIKTKPVSSGTSTILKGDYALDIHQQNQSILDNMTEQEILAEKEKLAAMVDPALLEYIRSLRKKTIVDPVKTETMECDTSESTINTQNDTSKDLDVSKIEKSDVKGEIDAELLENDIITDPNIHKWVHFDTFERDKLQWIKNLDTIEPGTENKPYEARFDFKGYLLPYSIEYNEETKILFHHGEEPHRPGYTINELFQLCRSTFTQQRSLALNTLAGILEYHSIGVYNGILSIPLTKIYFILRFALDENIPNVLEPTLRALRNLFYNRVDEVCLDSLLGSDRGLLQPRLHSSKKEIEETDSDVSELKDFHLADLDLIGGALRTDILPRIRYILSVIKPNFSCVEYCLQILVRIARDSLDNAECIFKVDGLMSYIVDAFIPKFISNMNLFSNDSERCKQISNTIRLVRILVCQSKSAAEYFHTKCCIFQSLMSFIGNMVAENVLMVKIQIETFYLWSSFTFYGFGFNELVDIKGLLLKILDNHTKTTDMSASYPVIMHSHLTALLTLLTNARLFALKTSQAVPDCIVNEFDYLVTLGLQKWLAQLNTIETFTAGHLKSVSAALLYLQTSMTASDAVPSNNIKTIDISVEKFMNSKGWDIISNLIPQSNLLSPIKFPSDQNDSNIPNLGGSMLDTSHSLPPTLCATSSINFVASLSKYIVSSRSNNLAFQFIYHKNISNYVSAIGSISQLNLTDNWFSKIELDMLYNIICLSFLAESRENQKEIIYNLSFRLTYILSPDYKRQLEFLLKNIVFNKSWFSSEGLMRNINISDSIDLLFNLDKISNCYVSTLQLKNFPENFCLVIDDWNSTVLPRDWMFMPILGLYSKIQDREATKLSKPITKALEEQTKDIIVSCLEWILVSELYFPDITAEIELTDRFCRLCCVFLCDNSLFLDPCVKALLQRCINIIFEIERSQMSRNKLDFDKPLLGINNFQDLYTQLVDHFQAVSYGDPYFSACILVPLSQKHNIKWRKLVWSEYAACLRALDCPEETLCYPMHDYLQPAELDFSLLKCYHRALLNNQVRVNTIAYKIAHHHVEMVKNRQMSNQTTQPR